MLLVWLAKDWLMGSKGFEKSIDKAETYFPLLRPLFPLSTMTNSEY